MFRRDWWEFPVSFCGVLVRSLGGGSPNFAPVFHSLNIRDFLMDILLHRGTWQLSVVWQQMEPLDPPIQVAGLEPVSFGPFSESFLSALLGFRLGLLMLHSAPFEFLLGPGEVSMPLVVSVEVFCHGVNILQQFPARNNRGQSFPRLNHLSVARKALIRLGCS